QLADDLLDVEGEEAEMGKALGKDEAAGKATLVSILGLEAARQLLDDLEAQAIKSLDSFGAQADYLRKAARFVTQRRN
ncbi:MAG: polyprenyl synthetase family protein, partial [Methyloligellaceae bacterium]